MVSRWVCAGALCGLISCGPSSTDPRAGRPPADPATAPAGLDRVVVGSPDQTCSNDADCVAGMTYACCGDCPAAPPFVARNRTNEAAEQAKVAKECETEDHDCSLHGCTPPPPSCRFAPTCRDGICAVISNAACDGSLSTATVDELTVGEALVLPGMFVPSASGSAGEDAVSLMGLSGGTVVTAVRPGTAAITYERSDGELRTVRISVVAHECRPEPRNPPLVLAVGGHAVLEVGPTRTIETAIRYPWVAHPHADEVPGRVRVLGQSPGRTTIVVEKEGGEIALWEVYVGGVCAEQGYTPVTAAVAPGMLGPKGDGTCVRRGDAGEVLSAERCPRLAALTKLSDERLGPIACEWAASCQRQGSEGCCIGCNNPFSVKLRRSCALELLGKTSCEQVRRRWDGGGCFD